MLSYVFFFFQAEDGIRDYKVTGVQTCALPIFRVNPRSKRSWSYVSLMRSRQSLNGDRLSRKEPPVENNKHEREKILVVRTLEQEDFTRYDIWQDWSYNTARFGHGQFHEVLQRRSEFAHKEPVQRLD